MGRAKEWMMEQAARGYSEADGDICADCVNDPFLKQWVSDSAEATECSFCGAESEDAIVAGRSSRVAGHSPTGKNVTIWPLFDIDLAPSKKEQSHVIPVVYFPLLRPSRVGCAVKFPDRRWSPAGLCPLNYRGIFRIHRGSPQGSVPLKDVEIAQIRELATTGHAKRQICRSIMADFCRKVDSQFWPRMANSSR